MLHWKQGQQIPSSWQTTFCPEVSELPATEEMNAVMPQYQVLQSRVSSEVHLSPWPSWWKLWWCFLVGNTPMWLDPVLHALSDIALHWMMLGAQGQSSHVNSKVVHEPDPLCAPVTSELIDQTSPQILRSNKIAICNRLASQTT